MRGPPSASGLPGDGGARHPLRLEHRPERRSSAFGTMLYQRVRPEMMLAVVVVPMVLVQAVRTLGEGLHGASIFTIAPPAFRRAAQPNAKSAAVSWASCTFWSRTELPAPRSISTSAPLWLRCDCRLA